MRESSDDLCPRPEPLPPMPAPPAAAPLYTASVYRCQSPAEANALLAGEISGYVYSRDGHPNADMLAEKCRQLHGASKAAICGSGMAALAAVVLSQMRQGDHLVASNRLYGRTLQLLTGEIDRLGMASTVVDTSDLEATRAAITGATRLVIVETISNPLLRVADIPRLAQLAHGAGAKLVVDNTFASPVICRPLEHGADLVVESLTKIMSGHSDVLLGLVCGHEQDWDRMGLVLSAWGLPGNPFDCWLASRGLGTLALRTQRAADTAMQVAQYLEHQPALETVHYPGLPGHPDHDLVGAMLGGRGGTMVTFTLKGGRRAAEVFIAQARRIAFCPSLGDLNTTLSHPASTSHRLVEEHVRRELGIGEGTIRLSVGIESAEGVLSALAEGLAGL